MLLCSIDNLRSHSWSYECLSCICPGFDVLQKLLITHIHLPQIYGSLAALLLGKSDFQVSIEQVSAVFPFFWPFIIICINFLWNESAFMVEIHFGFVIFGLFGCRKMLTWCFRIWSKAAVTELMGLNCVQMQLAFF